MSGGRGSSRGVKDMRKTQQAAVERQDSQRVQASGGGPTVSVVRLCPAKFKGMCLEDLRQGLREG